MRRTLIVVVHHVLLVLEDRDDGDGEALRALVDERLAGLHVEDVWLAVLGSMSVERLKARQEWEGGSW